MGSNPLFPFERNRYYSGKMLTSSDFAAEQQYVNNKKSFMNRHMYGFGVVCGCNVYGIDEATFLVESGLAIDSQGRELVIDSAVVKKISAVEGYEKISSDCVDLCLRYKEELSQPVYAVSRANAESKYEFNRIQEGYELFLKDVSEESNLKNSERKFLLKKDIYKNEDYVMSLIIPSTVCKNKKVKLQLVVKKTSMKNEKFEVEGSIRMPSFCTEEGEHELYINFSEVCLEKDQTVTKEYWVEVQDTQATEACVMWIQSGSSEELSVKVQISELEPRKIVNYEVGKVNLEQENNKNEETVVLARLNLLRKDGSCCIKSIEEKNIKKYIETPSGNRLRNEYLEFFQGKDSLKTIVKEEVSKEDATENSHCSETKMQIATGIIEIPIGGKAKAGEVFYSGEVMHGLGTGAVYVEIGQELMEEDSVKGANVKSTIYGNSKLFSQAGEMLHKTEKAVKVLNDKGSFIAAVSFTEDTECLMVSYRWVAFKVAESDKTKIEEHSEKQWIEAVTPTVVLGTRESYYFGVKFHEMDKCNITYQVTEDDGGEITPDGIYTAPNREGVFEITISCAERPYICTYAYAIVKKK